MSSKFVYFNVVHPKNSFLSCSPASKLMLQVLDSAFVEHDAYILFDKLMTFGKSWYEFNNDVPNRKATNSNTKVFMSIY